MTAEARDARGNKARAIVTLSADPLGDNLLLRLDQAVYKGGDTVAVDVRTTAGLPTVFLDVVKSGQTMLTRWLDVKNGQASCKLDLPATVFGTLEVHAYQMLASGEILRDSAGGLRQPGRRTEDQGERRQGGVSARVRGRPSLRGAVIQPASRPPPPWAC